MFCETETFKKWFRELPKLIECACAEYGQKYHIVNEVQVHIARTDSTFVWTVDGGWRDATNDPPHDIKQQIPTPRTAAWLGNGVDHTPTDDELYGTAKFGRPVWFIKPIQSGVVDDRSVYNEQLLRAMDADFIRNKFVDTIDFSIEGKIG